MLIEKINNRQIEKKQSIEAILNGTWFDVDSESFCSFSISTRRNGNIVDEIAGGKDILEAERLIKLFNTLDGLQAKYRVCGEWVTISISEFSCGEKK